MEHGWNTDGTRIGTRNADGTRIEHGLEKGPVFIDQKGSHENQPKQMVEMFPVVPQRTNQSLVRRRGFVEQMSSAALLI